MIFFISVNRFVVIMGSIFEFLYFLDFLSIKSFHQRKSVSETNIRKLQSQLQGSKEYHILFRERFKLQ